MRCCYYYLAKPILASRKVIGDRKRLAKTVLARLKNPGTNLGKRMWTSRRYLPPAFDKSFK
jgi:hypothetical protein